MISPGNISLGYTCTRFMRVAGIIAMLAAALPVHAQVTAAISGKVVDASRPGVIAGANITAKSSETGATRVTTTNDSGDYRVDALPLGAMEVHATKTGFKEVVRKGIDLVVGQDATVNLRLEVGDKVTRIDVMELVPAVNITTAPISGLVTEEQVKDLPLNGRSLDALITTNPGALNYSALK